MKTLINIEGNDGSGKDTIISMLKDYFSKRDDIIFTREPGGTNISEKIREIILDVDNTEMTSLTEAYLYAASRMQHVEEKILPNLKEGKTVITNRFIPSSICYQGYGRELNLDIVKMINNPAKELLNNNIINIIILVTPEEGIRRKENQEGHQMDRLEKEEIDFHKRIYNGFKEIIKENPENCIEIDANKEIERVFQNVLKYVLENMQ